MNIRFGKAVCIAALYGTASLCNAQFALMSLDESHKVVSQADQDIWFEGTIDVLQDYNSCVLFVYHAYLHDSNIAKLDVADYAQTFYTWLGTIESHQAGAHYEGALFKLHEDANDPVGHYDHRSGSFTLPPVMYMYYDGNNQPDHRSNEVAFDVDVVPEPCTLTLLAVTGPALLRRRTKTGRTR